jgi:DNA-binding NtrC family response regulator
MMPRMDGFAFLRTLMERGHKTPAIVLTGFGNIAQAVSIVHELRAFWFLEKPAQQEILQTLLDRAIKYGALLHKTEILERELSYQGMLGEMVGASDCMRQVYGLIQRAAPTNASVLITGESGTGKEMVARTLHRLSARADGPFVPINCAALPADLIESELFGHEKGSFTGATGRHPGCFEQANGGTLFLDEIGEMPAAMQARLLRALEESKVRRLGGTAEIPVDVRILAATNRPVEQLDRAGLREDLYYRLNVFCVHLPPLRERKSDIPAITTAIIGQLNQKHGCQVTNIHPSALEHLMEHNWPGNVRELRNVLEWAVITAGSDCIFTAHLPRAIQTGLGEKPAALVAAPSGERGIEFHAGRTLEEIENEYIRLTMESVNRDKRKAARLLGISLRTLYTRLAEENHDTPTVHAAGSP